MLALKNFRRPNNILVAWFFCNLSCCLILLSSLFLLQLYHFLLCHFFHFMIPKFILGPNKPFKKNHFILMFFLIWKLNYFQNIRQLNDNQKYEYETRIWGLLVFKSMLYQKIDFSNNSSWFFVNLSHISVVTKPISFKKKKKKTGMPYVVT